MRTFLSIFALLLSFSLTACGNNKPLAEEQEAAQYNLTVEELRQERRAGARMNMSWEEHSKMLKQAE